MSGAGRPRQSQPGSRRQPDDAAGLLACSSGGQAGQVAVTATVYQIPLLEQRASTGRTGA
jgi:hypothetical protein